MKLLCEPGAPNRKLYLNTLARALSACLVEGETPKRLFELLCRLFRCVLFDYLIYLQTPTSFTDINGLPHFDSTSHHASSQSLSVIALNDSPKISTVNLKAGCDQHLVAEMVWYDKMLPNPCFCFIKVQSLRYRVSGQGFSGCFPSLFRDV